MAPLLRVESVSVRHWRGERSTLVLDEVSLDLEAGVVGGVWAERNGGKTTFARVVAGALPPDSGRVLVDGHSVTGDLRRGRRGVVHSRIGLASRTGPRMPDLPVGAWLAGSMLAHCSWREAKHRAVIALDRVGAGGLGAARWSELSDSERTVVAIARAMVRDPQLLVVDDLVAGLDALHRAEVLSMIHGIAQAGAAVLMMSVDLSDLKATERIWSLSDGKLNGTPARAMADVVELRRAARRPQ